MVISEKEAIASLRALVCMAKADGVLEDQELRALQGALEGVESAVFCASSDD